MTRDQMFREVNATTLRIASLATALRQQFNPGDVDSIASCVGDAKAIAANLDDLGKALNNATSDWLDEAPGQDPGQAPEPLRFTGGVR